MSSNPKWSLRELLEALPQASLVGSQLGEQSLVIEGVSTDSRRCPKGALFVALRGEQFDGHDFLEQAIGQGAGAVLVQQDHGRNPATLSVPALVVPDTLQALGSIAAQWRSRFAVQMIAVTGSNGKTTVKEMIASILRAHFGEASLSTQGNLNNEIGVPQTLLRLNAQHRAAVIEMGMNHPGEIARIAAIGQANVALVTNAQREHQEFMQSVEAVARENGSAIAALPANGVAVFPADEVFTPVWRELSGTRRQITFGWMSNDLGVNANVNVNANANSSANSSATNKPDVSAPSDSQPESFSMTMPSTGSTDHTVQISLNIAGQHNVRNALAASAACLALGVSIESITRGLTDFKPVKGRMRRHALENGIGLIDDSYNANPDSVLAAIAVLSQSHPALLVLGDMGEVGLQGPQFHAEVGAAAARARLAGLFSFGAASREAHRAFAVGIEHLTTQSVAKHFETIDELVVAVKHWIEQQATANAAATVLVKGSRSMRMERVVDAVLESVHAA